MDIKLNARLKAQVSAINVQGKDTPTPEPTTTKYLHSFSITAVPSRNGFLYFQIWLETSDLITDRETLVSTLKSYLGARNAMSCGGMLIGTDDVVYPMLIGVYELTDPIQIQGISGTVDGTTITPGYVELPEQITIVDKIIAQEK